MIVLVALLVYDLRWMLLPTALVYTLGIFVAGFRVITLIQGNGGLSLAGTLLDVIFGAACLGGFFWLIYQVSAGKWIGGGDVRLGLALWALLGWQKALLTLAGSAYLGTLVILVLVLTGKYHKKLKLPYGPLLIIAAIGSFMFGQHIITWYLHISTL